MHAATTPLKVVAVSEIVFVGGAVLLGDVVARKSPFVNRHFSFGEDHFPWQAQCFGLVLNFRPVVRAVLGEILTSARASLSSPRACQTMPDSSRSGAVLS